eukprot:g455.t1
MSITRIRLSGRSSDPPPLAQAHSGVFEVSIDAHTTKLGIVFADVGERGGQNGVKIREVKQHSPLRGQIEAGDRLLDVNGQSVLHMALKQVMQTIVSKARETDAANEPRIFTFLRGEVVVVHIEPHTKKLGVVLADCEDGQPKGVRIRTIKKRSPMTGQIEAGAVLLDVNGRSMRGMALQQMMEAVIQTMKEIQNPKKQGSEESEPPG